MISIDSDASIYHLELKYKYKAYAIIDESVLYISPNSWEYDGIASFRLNLKTILT
jgi:hypothetical protein